MQNWILSCSQHFLSEFMAMGIVLLLHCTKFWDASGLRPGPAKGALFRADSFTAEGRKEQGQMQGMNSRVSDMGAVLRKCGAEWLRSKGGAWWDLGGKGP